MNSSLTENRTSDGWANPIDTSGQVNRAFGEVSQRTGPPVGVRVGRIYLSLGGGASEGAPARAASAEVRSAGRRRRFVWLGVFGVTSWATVLLSIKSVVASGEWSSPVDQDHPGDLWPGSWTSVLFGVTPAAGPGFVVALISRAADHCVTGIERQDETFGTLNREHLVGRVRPLGEWLPSAPAVIGVGMPDESCSMLTTRSAIANP
jgi:hypothetical protein